MASARGNKYLIILFMLFEGLHRHLGSFYDLVGLSEKLFPGKGACMHKEREKGG